MHGAGMLLEVAVVSAMLTLAYIIGRFDGCNRSRK